MSERVRTDDNLSCEVRLEEYCDIKRLIDEFGDAAYPAVQRYYNACGFENGYGVQHKDICTIHKRAFVEGVAQVIEAFVPGVQVYYTNASSRTLDPQADCIEAFHVVFPW